MLNSLVTLENPFNSTEDIIKWIEERNKEIEVVIEQIPFRKMEYWNVGADGSLRHDSGRFFSIQGIHVSNDYGTTHEWDQPIINQPEVGYLGILTKEIKGVLYFLMQAKIEPGNINCVQISPTLQATKSNYKCVHQGNSPAYLSYFIKARPEQILLDQLQSEQGARFLRKRNRNIIIKVEDEIEVLPDFIWMTLGQIKLLMSFDNIVNMDTRTVISGIDFSKYKTPLFNKSMLGELGQKYMKSFVTEVGLYDINEQISWLSNLKSKYDLEIFNKDIVKLEGWQMTDKEISRIDNEYFKILGVKVSISNREVKSWCQPLVQPQQNGICALIIKEIDGVLHLLLQAKLECGNFDVMELAPTVQCLTGKYMDEEKKVDFLEYVLNAPKENIIYDVFQSEEGGRFYHEQNRNIIVKVDNTFDNNVPEHFRWMTLNQIFQFMKFNNFLNIQTRSLISALKYI